MTDSTILSLASRPDTLEEGFRVLMGKYQQRLYHVIRSKVSSHEDADDVLQNTFLKVFRHLANFEHRSELFTWMYRIALNEVHSHHRRNHRTKAEPLDNHAEHEASTFANTEALPQLLEIIVSSLPERQQMVFRMRYYDELSYKEMAAMLKLSEGALKASFHHAAKKIEEEIKAKQIY